MVEDSLILYRVALADNESLLTAKLMVDKQGSDQYSDTKISLDKVV